MIRKLWNSASGMLAQSLKIDVIANNVANINTAGFKKKDVHFQDIMYRSLSGPGNPVVPDNGDKILVGQGVKPAAIKTVFSQGILMETGRELDMAILGDGYFRVLLPDGREAFTRVGAFALDQNMNLVTEDGYLVDLLPPELAGKDLSGFSVGSDGTIILYIYEEGDASGEGEAAGEGNATEEEGEAVIYRFGNPEGLEARGRNLWMATENSGEPIGGKPEEDGFGSIAHKFLEQSNVSIIDEMTNLILAQRAYEISARAVRTADEMWSMANQIRK